VFFNLSTKLLKVSVQGTYDGQLVENKFYAKAAEAVTDVMVAALAGVVEDWVHNTMLAHLPSAYVFTRTVARDLTSEASFESISSAHTGETGAITSTPAMPGNVTIAVHRDTGLSGKKAKSRIYWPGLNTGALTGENQFSTAEATALIDALDTLRDDILADTSTTWTYGYVQRIIDHVKLTAGNFIEVFHHSVTDRNMDSQRRRLAGRGR